MNNWVLFLVFMIESVFVSMITELTCIEGRCF